MMRDAYQWPTLRALREQRGFTVQQLADRAAVSPAAIIAAARGLGAPTATAQQKLAAALGVKPGAITWHTHERGPFGEGVRRQRKALGLSQTQLGRMVGIDISTVSRIERGEYLPQPTTVRKIATALRVSVEELTAPDVAGEAAGDGV